MSRYAVVAMHEPSDNRMFERVLEADRMRTAEGALELYNISGMTVKQGVAEEVHEVVVSFGRDAWRKAIKVE